MPWMSRRQQSTTQRDSDTAEVCHRHRPQGLLYLQEDSAWGVVRSEGAVVARTGGGGQAADRRWTDTNTHL